MMMLWYTYIFWLILYNFYTLWWFSVWLIVSLLCYCFYVWVETVNSHNGMNKVFGVAHSKCSKSWLMYSGSDIYMSVSFYVALKSAFIVRTSVFIPHTWKFLHTPPFVLLSSFAKRVLAYVNLSFASESSCFCMHMYEIYTAWSWIIYWTILFNLKTTEQQPSEVRGEGGGGA